MLYTPEERNQIQHAYEMALRNSRAWEVLLPSEKLNILQSIEDKIAGAELYETIMKGFMDRVNKMRNLAPLSKKTEVKA